MRYFHFLFWPVLVATFIVAFIQIKDKTYLQNDTAPQGIVSLELGGDFQRDTSIIQSWKSDTLDRTSVTLCQPTPQPINRLRKARFDVCIDYLFILLYTGLGLIIIIALQTRIQQKKHWFTRLLIGLILLAGLLDCIENIGLLRFIDDGLNSSQSASNPAASASTATITHLAAYAKFIIILLLAGLYLPLTLIIRDNGLFLLTDYIRNKTFQLFRYRVLLIGLAFFSLPIWVMDQGQDLLININTSDQGVFLFMGVVLIAAFLNWWLAKLFFENKALRPVFPLKELPVSEAEEEKQEKKASRFLGVATIIIPAVAILNALQAIRMPSLMDFFPAILWLIALLIIFFVLIKNNVIENLYLQLQQKWGKKKSKYAALLTLFLLAIGIPTIIRLTAIQGSSSTPHSLIYLFWHLVFLAFAFLLFVSVRTCIYKEGLAASRIGTPIIILSLILAILFILFNAFPQAILSLDCNFLSLPVLLSGIITYTLVLTLLIRISLLRKTNYVLFFIITAVLISITVDNDYHSVRTMDTKASPTSIQLEDYFKQWLLKRKDEIRQSTTYPVFLVNSYGGGIKAAAFTNMVVTYLDSVLIAQEKDHKGFEHFVFSFSGASGGTIGSAIQCAYRARHLDSSGYTLNHFSGFYGHDFLTPTLGAMFGRDVWASITGQHSWRDRAAVQTNIWEGFGQQALGLDLAIPFDALWDTVTTNPGRYEVPLLFSNTLNVDNGQKGICAPVLLNKTDFPGAIFIRSRLDSINAHRGDRPVQDLSLLTGAFLSARFPFISPSGKMGPGYHFMDGGGKDNSGASTSEAIFISLNKEMQKEKATHPLSEMDSLMQKVHFYFISITNNPNVIRDERKLVSNRWEPISPLVGIINSGISGNAIEADRTLQMRYSSDTLAGGLHADYNSVWITGSCVEYKDGKWYEPVLPLGWQISSPSVQRLHSSFDDTGIRSYKNDGIPKIIRIILNK